MARAKNAAGAARQHTAFHVWSARLFLTGSTQSHHLPLHPLPINQPRTVGASGLSYGISEQWSPAAGAPSKVRSPPGDIPNLVFLSVPSTSHSQPPKELLQAQAGQALHGLCGNITQTSLEYNCNKKQTPQSCNSSANTFGSFKPPQDAPSLV